jgi:hypothetical protein
MPIPFKINLGFFLDIVSVTDSLSMTERIDFFCDYTDLALNFNPDLADKKDDQSFKGRIQIISNP